MKKISAAVFSIHDLCEQTGLPRRTIHFYTQQGLIPPPEGAGPGTRYSELHLLRLRAIPRLRQQGMRLDEIRLKLTDISTEELRGLLTNPVISPPPLDTPAMQSYTHFTLPGGITICAPQKLSPVEQRKFDQLLKQAQQIYQTNSHKSEQEE